MVKVGKGAGIFIKHVGPYLKKWTRKSGKALRGVLKGSLYEMEGLGLKKGFRFVKRSAAEREALRAAFDATERKAFLKGLKESELKAAGLTEAEIAKVMRGEVPKGFQVHHKFPLDDSGTNVPENLVLIRNSPDHQLLTNHQNYTTGHLKPGESVTVDWPTFPAGTSVWPPAGGGAKPIPTPKGR